MDDVTPVVCSLMGLHLELGLKDTASIKLHLFKDTITTNIGAWAPNTSMVRVDALRLNDGLRVANGSRQLEHSVAMEAPNRT